MPESDKYNGGQRIYFILLSYAMFENFLNNIKGRTEDLLVNYWICQKKKKTIYTLKCRVVIQLNSIRYNIQ